MRERELREAAKCGLCGKLFGESGLPMFWRVTVARYGVDGRAVQRQAGLEMVFNGNVALAQVFSPDEEMTTTLMEPQTMTVCEPCATESTCVAALAERMPEPSAETK